MVRMRSPVRSGAPCCDGDPGAGAPAPQLELDRPDDSPYDVYDFFDPVPAAETDATVDGYERIDTRPRVRVYGCCLPIALGMLLALVATVTLLQLGSGGGKQWSPRTGSTCCA